MIDELLEKAKGASLADIRRVSTEKWLPIVDVLRRKNFTWVQIYDWLIEQGENVQARKGTFISCMSRRYKNYIASKCVGGGR